MRYFIEVMYDGSYFRGSQLQGNELTVQLILNRALSTLLRENILTYGASRTDSDVHALSNFYHFDTDGDLKTSFIYNINSILPHAIAVKEIWVANNNELNARFAAISRRYRYRIYSKKDPFRHKRVLYYPFAIDESLLNETAAILKEYTNFETFSKRNTQTRTFQCSIIESYWERQNDELQYVVSANRFLRGMVRALVGTQLLVARGKLTSGEFRKIIESKDCTRADFSTPGYGLYLENITYPEDSFKIPEFVN